MERINQNYEYSTDPSILQIRDEIVNDVLQNHKAGKSEVEKILENLVRADADEYTFKIKGDHIFLPEDG